MKSESQFALPATTLLIWVTRILLFVGVVLFAGLSPISAQMGDGAAKGLAASAAALSACESRPQGKETHNCVADVLERYGNRAHPEVRSAFLDAASRLRAAANKAQAILAIVQCQNVISAALKSSRSAGGAGGFDYAARVLVLAHRLIQRKG